MYSDGLSFIFHLIGINRVRAVHCVILNIKSENQALFLQGMYNFAIYYFEF